MSADIVEDMKAASAEAAIPETQAPVEVTAEALGAEPVDKGTPESGRARDGQGRFAKGEKSEAPKPKDVLAEPVTTPVELVQEAKPQTATHKAPQSWRPAVREKWNSLPPDVQEEVVRREREASTALRETANARRTAEAFERTVAPYRGLLTGDPVQVAEGLFRTAATLKTGSRAEKAKLVADLVRHYDVDIQSLDSALAGQAPAHQPQEFRDPRFDQFLAQQQQWEAQQRAQLSAQADRDLESFQSSHEFFEDVRHDMADMIASATSRGVVLSLQDAYDKACWANVDVRKALQQREGQKANAQASTLKAQAAASSVKTQPASGPRASSGRGTVMDDMLDVVSSMSRR